MSWEEFLERLLERLHEYHRLSRKVDVLIMLGRRNKLTGELEPPKVQIREFEI
jgi:hypothetical protein